MTQYKVPVVDTANFDASQVVLTNASKQIISACALRGLICQNYDGVVAVANNSAGWNLAAAHDVAEDAVNGLVKCNGSGSYTAVTDNSTNWNLAVAHRTAENAINGLVKCDGSGNYSAVTDASANWNTAYGWGNHASAGYYPIISSDVTYYVSTSGNDTTGNGSVGTPWATIAKALEYLGPFAISSAATVTIQLADGIYTPATPYLLNHKFGQRINITGTNTHTKTVSSIQSVSGSAGAWSIVLNMNNVTSVSSGDYIIIRDCSGGTNPSYLVGCHKITNVDSGNSRITITSAHKNATNPSGAVTTTNSVVIKTIISSTQGAFECSVPWGYLTKIVCEGPGVTTYYGIVCTSAVLELKTPFAVSNYVVGISSDSSRVSANYLVASGCAYGILATNNSTLLVSYALATGCSYGIASGQCSYIISQISWATGCTTGVFCTDGSYVQYVGSGGSGNTTDYSPTANAVGNYNSFIRTA
jgi:hypothetical protein